MAESFTECHSGSLSAEIFGSPAKEPWKSEKNGSRSGKAEEHFLSKSRIVSLVRPPFG